MKRRTPLPPIFVAGVRADDPSQDADGAYFTRNPAVLEYTRAYIAGETHEPMPLGTRVIVRRIGRNRARAFVAPQEGLN
jgi:hypothetical protein